MEGADPRPPRRGTAGSVIKPSGKGCHGTNSKETKLHLYGSSGASGRSRHLCPGRWGSAGHRGPYDSPGPLPCVGGGAETLGCGSEAPGLCLV